MCTRSMPKNKKVVSVDTNVLLRLMLHDVPEQTTKAEKWVMEHTCHIADLAITETMFVLEKVYEMPRNDIAENIFAIIRNPRFCSNRVLFEKALPVYMDNPSVSINDCLLATYAEINQAIPHATFDKKLAKVYPKSAILL